MPPVTFGSFSLDVSPDWTLSTIILSGPIEDTPSDPRLLTAKAPPSFRQNVVVTMEQVPAQETPESYVKRQRDELRKAGISFHEPVSSEKVQLDSGLDGFLSEQVVVGAGGEWVRQMQLVSIKDGVAYTLIASHLDGAPFEQTRDRFRAMLLSFG